MHSGVMIALFVLVDSLADMSWMCLLYETMCSTLSVPITHWMQCCVYFDKIHFEVVLSWGGVFALTKHVFEQWVFGGGCSCNIGCFDKIVVCGGFWWNTCSNCVVWTASFVDSAHPVDSFRWFWWEHSLNALSWSSFWVCDFGFWQLRASQISLSRVKLISCLENNELLFFDSRLPTHSAGSWQYWLASPVFSSNCAS